MRVLLTSAALVLSALPAFADETSGTVLAYDRVSNILVLDDKTVWELPDELALPDDLIAGDAITIEYQSAGEDGVTSIDVITRN